LRLIISEIPPSSSPALESGKVSAKPKRTKGRVRTAVRAETAAHRWLSDPINGDNDGIRFVGGLQTANG
ncbi:hypothetical protein GE21DRAFT_1241974, partial [Neurospora crassa]